MGVPREAPPAKLFAAVMHRPDFSLEPVLARLADSFGAIDARSDSFAFTQSAFYENEMGPGLMKFFVSFGPTVPQERLAIVKLATNRMEKEGRDARGRLYNIDPGLVTLSAVILATTKDCAHRVYVGEGIYEEVTLIYRGGAYEPLPWTYPDYRLPGALAFMKRVRDIAREQLREYHPVA
jgi:hypothetical protein